MAEQNSAAQQCQATTRSHGRQCLNRALENSQYCRVHQDYEADPPKRGGQSLRILGFPVSRGFYDFATGHPAQLLTLLYVAVAAYGSFYSYVYFSYFDLNYFEYASVTDFLISSLQQPIVIFTIGVTLIVFFLALQLTNILFRATIFFELYTGFVRLLDQLLARFENKVKSMEVDARERIRKVYTASDTFLEIIHSVSYNFYNFYIRREYISFRRFLASIFEIVKTIIIYISFFYKYLVPLLVIFFIVAFIARLDFQVATDFDQTKLAQDEIPPSNLPETANANPSSEATDEHSGLFDGLFGLSTSMKNATETETTIDRVIAWYRRNILDFLSLQREYVDLMITVSRPTLRADKCWDNARLIGETEGYLFLHIKKGAEKGVVILPTGRVNIIRKQPSGRWIEKGENSRKFERSNNWESAEPLTCATYLDAEKKQDKQTRDLIRHQRLREISKIEFAIDRLAAKLGTTFIPPSGGTGTGQSDAVLANLVSRLETMKTALNVVVDTVDDWRGTVRNWLGDETLGDVIGSIGAEIEKRLKINEITKQLSNLEKISKVLESCLGEICNGPDGAEADLKRIAENLERNVSLADKRTYEAANAILNGLASISDVLESRFDVLGKRLDAQDKLLATRPTVPTHHIIGRPNGCERNGSISSVPYGFNETEKKWETEGMLIKKVNAAFGSRSTELPRVGSNRRDWIILEGHTDQEGSASVNANISKQRAEDVREFLSQHSEGPKLNIAIIKVVGLGGFTHRPDAALFGATQSEPSKEEVRIARADDRRVDIIDCRRSQEP